MPTQTTPYHPIPKIRVPIRNIADYSPFGVQLDGRTISMDSYRYGFNGMEKVDEVKGGGNSYDFGARLYNPRIGRWMSRDPHESKYPAVSGYVFSLNSPLLFKDVDGKDAIVTVQKDTKGGGTITISSTIYITGKAASKEKANDFTQLSTNILKEGTYKSESGDYKIRFDVKYEFIEDASKLKLKKGENLLDLNGEANQRSFIKGTIRTFSDEKCKITEVQMISGNTGVIGSSTEMYSTMHESLHLLGLSDRYDEGGSAHLGFTQDIMGTNGEADISQVHYDNFGKTFSKMAKGVYENKLHIDVDKKGKLVGGQDLKTQLKFDVRDYDGSNEEDTKKTYGE